MYVHMSTAVLQNGSLLQFFLVIVQKKEVRVLMFVFVVPRLNNTACLKNSQNCFCHNFVKFSPTLIIFGTKMAKMIELCKVYSITTSPNLC